MPLSVQKIETYSIYHQIFGQNTKNPFYNFLGTKFVWDLVKYYWRKEKSSYEMQT